MDCVRYAIWWVPRPGSALARFGMEWTGWCPDRGVTGARRALAALSRPRAGVPGTVRLRGLHATVRAPFRLAEGRSQWGLEGALAEIAGRTVPIRLPRLRLVVDDGRLVLSPMRPDESVTRLVTEVAEAVRPFQVAPDYAAVAGPGAMAAGGLVLPAAPGEPVGLGRSLTRFRIPLTDRMELGAAAEIAAELAPALGPVLLRPQVMADLALVGDPGRGRPWRLLERFPLEGEGEADPRRVPAGMDATGPSLMAPLGSAERASGLPGAFPGAFRAA